MKTPALLTLVALSVAAVRSDAALQVVATTSDLAWFAREIGGDRVEVTAIAKGYQDPHYVEPRPSYLVALARADLLLHAGLELEVGWLPRLLDGAGNPAIQEGSAGLWSPAGIVRILERPSGAVDRSSGDIHPFGNPHYWLDPDNARRIASGLADKLAQLDPQGAAGYRERAARLDRAIGERDAEWKERLKPHAGLKLITYHRTFSYFIEHFGLAVLDYVEPRPGVPPSAQHLATLVGRARSEGARLLLIESFFDPRDGKFVAAKTGLPLVVAPVSVGSTPEIRTWFDLIETLVAAVESTGKGS